MGLIRNISSRFPKTTLVVTINHNINLWNMLKTKHILVDIESFENVAVVDHL